MRSRTSVAARARLGRGISAVGFLDLLSSWMLDGSHRRPGSHADILSCQRGCARGHACGVCRARPRSGGEAARRSSTSSNSVYAQSRGSDVVRPDGMDHAGLGDHSSASLELGPGVPTRRRVATAHGLRGAWLDCLGMLTDRQDCKYGPCSRSITSAVWPANSSAAPLRSCCDQDAVCVLQTGGGAAGLQIKPRGFMTWGALFA